MINVVACIITTDFYKDEKYILSTSLEDIHFPKFDLQNYSNFNTTTNNTIIENCFHDQQMAKGYVKPKLIDINPEYLSHIYDDTNNMLYFIKGCLCPKLILKDGFYWKSFDFLNHKNIHITHMISDAIERTI